jgi:ribosomal protein S12 methylthiotransferase accessory factor
MLFHRCKDVGPRETRARIEAILAGLGIGVEESQIYGAFDALHSCRLNLAGTPIGVNGKGTTPELALTSGMAEFLERLQNQMLWGVDFSEEDKDAYGFRYDVSERALEGDLDIPSAFDRAWLYSDGPRLTDRAREYGTRIVEQGLDERLVPFYDRSEDRVIHLPFHFLLAIMSSNGMCAGNSPEEAVVQGLCEVYERFAMGRLYFDRLAPPPFPEDVLREFAPRYLELASRIEDSGEFRVFARDCSLGMGLPVAGVVLVSPDVHRFTLKLGADPNLDIALERCLTELYQGRMSRGASVVNSLSVNPAPADPTVTGWHENVQFNTMQDVFPLLHSAEATLSYPFGWPVHRPCASQLDRYRSTIEPADRHGYPVYVRDVSFLGFPSFWVVVPGMSEIYALDKERWATLTKPRSRVEWMKDLANLDDQAMDRLIDDMRGYLAINATIRDPRMHHYLGANYFAKQSELSTTSVPMILSMLLYKRGLIREAHRTVSRHAESLAGDAPSFVRVAREILALECRVQDPDSVLEGGLASIYDPDVVSQATDFYRLGGDRPALLEDWVHCWSCSKCPWANDCSYATVREAYLALKREIAANPIDQQTSGRALPR